MIELTAKIKRGPVFLAGEILQCIISFTNSQNVSHKLSQSNKEVFESVAWASAQIQSQCFTDPKLSKEQEEKAATGPSAFADTTLAAVAAGQDSGKVVVQTEPKILFCDLKLAPGETKTFIYREKIPTDSPPSYRGQLVKYSYKVIIGTQQVNKPVKVLRIPIRIMPLSDPFLNEAAALCSETAEELTPTNPFLEVKKKQSSLDVAMESLQLITARRSPHFYMIRNSGGKVVQFCLFKSAYKLGEDIVGTFDFTVATVHCMQVSVSLQCEEETTIEQDNATGAGTPVKQTRVITYNKYHQVCLGYSHTQLVLPIPLHVTPTFKTNIVNLTWRLHFEFVTSTNEKLKGPSPEDTTWQAPAEVQIETMVWSMPIRLYSTTPYHAAQGVQCNNSYKLVIK